MNTLLIEVTNQDAYPLLKELEKLHLIKVIQKNTPVKRLSERFAGKLSSQDAEKLQEHIKHSRNEWDI